MNEQEEFRARWWLVATVGGCALLGLTPLAQALEYIRAPGFVSVALTAQAVLAVVWLVWSRRLVRLFVQRLSGTGAEARALGVLAATAVAVSIAATLALLVAVHPDSPYGWFTTMLLVWLGWLPTHLITAGLIVLVGSWTDAGVQQRRAADRQALLHAAAVRAELEALRARLEPHFLLNALNTVAALARSGDGDKAAEVAADLGELLRFALAESTDRIPFDAEREIVERYLAIEQARLGERLRIVWEIAPAARRAQLPPLVWQPLVENAIRHGIARRRAPGTLTLTATCADDVVTLGVDADGPAPDDVPAPVAPFGGLGIGTTATRRRLSLLYGDRASLELADRAGGTRTTLILPMHVPAAEPLA